MDLGAIFSVGYSGFGNNASALIAALKGFNINALIDVRSSPYSAYYYEFNKEALESHLRENGIVYRSYASEFGARQEDRAFYPNGYLDFELYAASSRFHVGIEKIEKGLDAGYRLAFLCSEKEPVNCHRAILVTRAFSDLGHEIKHILPDLSVKSQRDVEEELLRLHPKSLFDDSEIDDLTLAYRKQNQVIGFKPEGVR